jgi:2,3-bisphosphoglycerate-independent phosphoglycerate mutase
MKYAMVLPDGAADEPVPALDGRTPLAVARKPNIDWISVHGRQGRVVTVPKGHTPASDVATLSLFGYDPTRHYPGRAPLEAVARGITVKPGQMVFRCNFVTIADGKMEDFTAGHITQTESNQLIEDLNRHIGGDRCTFHSGVSYRNLMIVSNAGDFDLTCTPPHDFPQQSVEPRLPKGRGSDRVRNIMEQAHTLLAEHELNRVRQDLGENPATHIWLWGQGRPKPLETLEARYGVRGALIAGVDLIRGIALSAGLQDIRVEGATGYLDTDYVAKGKAAVDAVEEYDLVVVHVEAPDEAGHQGDAEAKIEAIERIDEHIVGPVLETLRKHEPWRILVVPDHPTPVLKKIHTADPPPFCLAGHAIQPVLGRPFSEEAAARSDLQIDPGYELMEFFLRV